MKLAEWIALLMLGTATVLGLLLIVRAVTLLIKRKTFIAIVFLAGGIFLVGAPALIVVPAFLKARNSARRHACIGNLRQLDACKDSYSLEYGPKAGSSVEWKHVAMYVKDLTNKCYCPSAPANLRYFESNYNLQVLGTDPTCKLFSGTTTQPNHSLQFKA